MAITSAKHDRIVALARMGMTASQIAAELEVAVSSITAHCKKFEIQVAKQYPRAPDRQNMKIPQHVIDERDRRLELDATCEITPSMQVFGDPPLHRSALGMREVEHPAGENAGKV
jgi:hypothetical protein